MIRSQPTVIFIHVLRVRVFPMAQMVPFRSTHRKLKRFVFLWFGESFQRLELVDVKRLGALELALYRL